MYELNGKQYSLEEIQAAADKSNLSLQDYITRANIKILDTVEQDFQTPTTPGAVVEETAAPDMDSSSENILLESQQKELKDYINNLANISKKENQEESLIGNIIRTIDYLDEVPANFKSTLKQGLLGARSSALGIVEDMGGKDVADFLAGGKNIGGVRFVDPESGKAISFNENPDRWKELNRLNQRTDTEIEQVYSTGEKVGEAYDAKIIDILKQYSDLTESRGYTGVGFTKGVKEGDIPSIIGGAFDFIGQAAASIGPALLTRGATLYPQISGMMVSDYNVEKAKALYGKNNPAALDQLVQNEEVDIFTPLAISVPAMALERVGFKGVQKWMLSPSISKGTKKMMDLTSIPFTSAPGREGWTEVGQLLADLFSRSIARGNDADDAIFEAMKQLTANNFEMGMDAYFGGFIGSGSIGIAGRRIRSAMMSDSNSQKTINENLNEIYTLHNARRSAKTKDAKESIDFLIKQKEGELKTMFLENDTSAKKLNDSERNRVLDLINQKDKIYSKYETLIKQNKEGTIDNKSLGIAKRGLTLQLNKINEQIGKIKTEVNTRQVSESADFAKTAGSIGLNTNTFTSTNDFQQGIENAGIKLNNKQKSQIDQIGALIDGNNIYINEQVAAETGQLNVGAHEVMHSIVDTYINNSNDLDTIVNDFKGIITEEQQQLVDQELKKRYTAKEYNSEYFSVFSELMADNKIKFETDIFTKIKDYFVELIRKYTPYKKLNIESAQDMATFLRRYNNSVQKGRLSKGLASAIGKVKSKDIKLSQEASNSVQNIYDKKGVDGAFEIIEQFNPIINKLVQRRSDAPNFNRQDLTDAIKYDDRGVLGLIRSYDPKSGVPLAAYINKFLPSRMIEASNKILGEEFTLDVTEAKGVVAQEAETSIDQPVSKKIKPSSLLKNKDLAVSKITEGIKNVPEKDLTFKRLKDLSPETTAEIFEVPAKKVTDPKANLNKGDLSNAARNINKNADKLLRLLPKGAVVEAASEKLLGTSTGVPKSLLDVFYTKQERLTRGAGLSPYKLNSINRQQFLEGLGIVDGKLREGLSPRSPEAQRIKAIMNLTGKLITNEIVRSETDLSLETKQDIAAGKSDIMFSKVAESTINDTLIELESGKSADKLLTFYGQDNIPKLKKIEDIPVIVDGIKNNILKLGPRDMWFGKPDKNGKFGTAFTSSYKLFGFSSKKAGNMKIWREYEKQIKELRNLDDSAFGKPIEGVKDYSKTSYSTIFKDEATIKKNIDNGKIDEFNEKNMAIHKELWSRINKAIRKDNSTAPMFGLYLKGVGSDTQHWHKIGAEFVGYSKNITGKRYEYEHAMPATQAYIYLLDASLSGKDFNAAYNGVMNNYKLIALDKAQDKKITSVGLQRKMPANWAFNKNFWYERYFNPKVAAVKGGIDPNGIIHVNGKTFSQEYNVSITGINTQIAEKNNQLLPPGQKIKFSKSKPLNNTEVNNKLENIDNASKEAAKKRNAKVDLNKEFNQYIEAATGIGAQKVFSEAKAEVRSKKVKKTLGDYFIPTSAEDFGGLMHKTLAPGKQGEQQLEFYDKYLYKPYNAAVESITREKVALTNDFRELKRNLSNVPKKLKKFTKEGDFTYDQAVRVYIWSKQGMDIPGLSKTDARQLIQEVKADKELMTFADELIKINKGDGYTKPENNWIAGNIATDLLAGLNKGKRTKHLEVWQENVDKIFSDKNKLKLEAAYGKDFVTNLNKTIDRMKTGSNRKWGGNKLVEGWLDWVNGSVGAIMFLNTRSAVLQTISSVNYMNFKDNNPLQAAKAFANQKQYWSDFKTIFNSDYLQERRGGNKINVNESELALAAEKGGVQGAISLLLNKGFIFTKIADSFAIASGGASMYRNRIKTYMGEGMNEAEATKKAFLDFKAITEETQQSSRPDRISEQQASNLGRVFLAFANTPMQYNRIIKRNAQDLAAGRGNRIEKVSKIIYYSTIQNIIFNALQKALFALAFNEDDDEEKEIKKYADVGNGMLDSLLRGSGLTGNAVVALKAIAIDINKQLDKPNPKFEDSALKGLVVSPPINSKVTKLRGAGYSLKYINEKNILKPTLDNPALSAAAQTSSALFNLPLDRALRKAQNIEAATRDEAEWWQSAALLMGWGSWELGMENEKDKKEKSIKRRSTKRRTSRRK